MSGHNICCLIKYIETKTLNSEGKVTVYECPGDDDQCCVSLSWSPGDSGLMNRNIGNEFAPPKCSDDSETNSSGGKLNDWTKFKARLWHRALPMGQSTRGIKRSIMNGMVLTCSRSLSSSASSTRVSASSCSSDCLGSGRRWAWWGSSGRRSSPLSGTGSAA